MRKHSTWTIERSIKTQDIILRRWSDWQTDSFLSSTNRKCPIVARRHLSLSVHPISSARASLMHYILHYSHLAKACIQSNSQKCTGMFPGYQTYVFSVVSNLLSLRNKGGINQCRPALELSDSVMHCVTILLQRLWLIKRRGRCVWARWQDCSGPWTEVNKAINPKRPQVTLILEQLNCVVRQDAKWSCSKISGMYRLIAFLKWLLCMSDMVSFNKHGNWKPMLHPLRDPILILPPPI